MDKIKYLFFLGLIGFLVWLTRYLYSVTPQMARGSTQ